MSVFVGHTAKSLAAAGLLAGLTMCVSAQASTPFSFNFTYGGGTNQGYSPSGPGTLVSSASTVTEGNNQVILTTHSTSGSPAGAVGDAIVYSATPLAVPAGATGVTVQPLTVNWDTFTFTAISGTYTRDPLDDAVNFRWHGTFSDSSGTLNSQAAQFSQTWSQSAPGNQPSTGGTFSSLGAGAVPEPMTWAMMLVGFAGIGFMLRKSRDKNALAIA